VVYVNGNGKHVISIYESTVEDDYCATFFVVKFISMIFFFFLKKGLKNAIQ